MNQQQFIDWYCDKSKAAWADLCKSRIAMPCNCEEEGCIGWAMVGYTSVEHQARFCMPQTIDEQEAWLEKVKEGPEWAEWRLSVSRLPPGTDEEALRKRLL